MIKSLRPICLASALRDSTICGLLMEPSCRRKQALLRLTLAIIDSYFQSKWNWITGVCPLGAQVRTRVGRSDNPDSTMKAMTRPSRRAFF